MAPAACLASVAVFAGVVVLLTLGLRTRLRAQILERDAAVLHSVVQLEVERAIGGDYGGIVLEDDPLGTLINVSQLDSVVALRLFDAGGAFFDAAPMSFLRGDVTPADLATLRGMRTVARFHPRADLRDYFYEPDADPATPVNRVPLLEVLVPVHPRGSSSLLGVAQFLLNGETTAQAFAQLDANLARQALAALLAGLLMGGGLLAWAFWRLQHANGMLRRRSLELLDANRELTRTAKTSAIGSVTAHLLHALKNPLASLQLYMEMQRETGGTDAEALESAGDAARRMQRLIHDAVAVLRQEETGEQFTFTLDEVAAIVGERCRGMAAFRGVRLVLEPAPAVELDNRRGNLLALAAINLAQNAVEATPEDGTVTLSWAQQGGGITLTVRDTGPGLPGALQADPFKPGVSAKGDGGGVGLSITRQLVRHMGGDVRLLGTGPTGTTFEVSFRGTGNGSSSK